ncbi:MAG TPA: hypothetical protein VM942_03500 [Acidimicrobiales bacterium]|nr:hypothetical protein [Acidimicrobiales bacterium]
MSPTATNPEHPDFDALSAHVDGEAPEWEAHVGGCAECQATAARLRAVSEMVGGAVPAGALSARVIGLARAMAAFEDAKSTQEPAGGTVDDHDIAALASMSAREPVREPAALEPVALREPAPVGGTTRGATAPGGGGAGSPTPIGSASRSRRRGGAGAWLGVGSAAAVLVAFVVGISALTGGGGGGDDDGTVAAGAPPAEERTATALTGEADSITSPAENSGAGVGGVDVVPGGTGATGEVGGVGGGDLGEIADETVLASRARPLLLQRDSTTAGAYDTGSGIAGVAPASEPAPTSRFVGTRPCEMEARTARPELGTVVYHATGRADGVAVVVLGFAAGPAPSPVTLLALAHQEGCRVVLEAVGP